VVAAVVVAAVVVAAVVAAVMVVLAIEKTLIAIISTIKIVSTHNPEFFAVT